MLSRLTLVALALLIAIAAVLPAGRYYRCRMDGMVHATCCCTANAALTDPGTCSAPDHGTCCDVVVIPSHHDQAMAAIPGVIDHVSPAIAVLAPVVPGLLVGTLEDRRAARDRPPRPSAGHRAEARIYQRFCTYLI